MVLFVIGCVFLLIAIAWFLIRPYYTPYRSERVSITKYGIIPLVLALGLILLSCFATVGTRNVGVETVFGKPTGDTLGAGLHFKAPWASVTDIDATIHPEEYKGDDCIYVKIADGGTACISLSYRWRIVPEAADTVYADYRNSDDDIDEAVRKALVSTNIKAAINEVFGAYDPLAGVNITENMTAEELANIKIALPDLEVFNTAIEKNVAEKIEDVGDLIDIQAVTVSYIELPENTQKRINAFNAAVQDTKIALQEVATKDAQAQGNEKLAASLKDPNVLVSKCLDALAAGDFVAPPGFSCWPGSGGAVLVPGTSK